MSTERRHRTYPLSSRRREVLILAPLGFAAGLPVVLTSGTLYAWMASEDVDLRTIGMFSLVGLPFALKFLWAPILDYVNLPVLGRRRGWIALTQLALVVGLFVMGAIGAQDTATLAIAAITIALLSANHIAAIDAYRTDLLSPKDRGAGAATYLLGFRIAGVGAGGLALILAQHVSWRAVYWAFAGLLAIAMLAMRHMPALGTAPEHSPQTLRAAVVQPWRDYFVRCWCAAGPRYPASLPTR